MKKVPRTGQGDATGHLFGELEAAIMRVMWTSESATVRDVLHAVNQDGRSLAYTTVMTVMGRLVVKNILVRELSGNTHIYRAALTEDQFLQRSAAERIHALVEEFGDLAIAQFFAEIGELSPKRRQQLLDMAKGDAQ
ncbi:MAG: BlaI/MecI/CopY family transcriptional regulator [Thermomicrobiales bacterium]